MTALVWTEQINTTRGTALAWAKLSDDLDEELAHLSAGAFRLYVASITYSRRRELGGVLAQRDLEAVARTQRINGVPKVLAELLDDGEDHPLWTCADGRFTIRAYEKYNPPTSTERVRKHRSEKRPETLHPVPVTQPRASARAPGSPVPDPVPVPGNGAKAPSPSKASPAFAEEVGRVFEAWVGAITAQYGSSDHKLTPERTEKIRARLAQGYSVEILLDAVVGWRRDAWHVEHHEFKLTTLLRNGEQVEKFAELERRVQPVMPKLKALVQGRGPSEFRPISYEDAFDSATEAVN